MKYSFLSPSKKMLLFSCVTIFFILLSVTCISPKETHVLVFSKTAGFRHASIPDGIQAIVQLGIEHHFRVDTTEDAGFFKKEILNKYDAVIFLSTSDDVLNAEQQQAFEEYMKQGGGFVGIHSASACEYEWPWYEKLVGAYFNDHPDIQEATIEVLDHDHPSTAHLPEYWTRVDEWYNFKTQPHENVNVLALLDETTYEGGTMGEYHPIAWYHEFEGGISWYTALGHTKESFSEPAFLKHILGGILYATGQKDVAAR